MGKIRSVGYSRKNKVACSIIIYSIVFWDSGRNGKENPKCRWNNRRRIQEKSDKKAWPAQEWRKLNFNSSESY